MSEYIIISLFTMVIVLLAFVFGFAFARRYVLEGSVTFAYYGKLIRISTREMLKNQPHNVEDIILAIEQIDAFNALKQAQDERRPKAR